MSLLFSNCLSVLLPRSSTYALKQASYILLLAAARPATTIESLNLTKLTNMLTVAVFVMVRVAHGLWYRDGETANLKACTSNVLLRDAFKLTCLMLFLLCYWRAFCAFRACLSWCLLHGSWWWDHYHLSVWNYASCRLLFPASHAAACLLLPSCRKESTFSSTMWRTWSSTCSQGVCGSSCLKRMATPHVSARTFMGRVASPPLWLCAPFFTQLRFCHLFRLLPDLECPMLPYPLQPLMHVQHSFPTVALSSSK